MRAAGERMGVAWITLPFWRGLVLVQRSHGERHRADAILVTTRCPP